MSLPYDTILADNMTKRIPGSLRWSLGRHAMMPIAPTFSPIACLTRFTLSAYLHVKTLSNSFPLPYQLQGDDERATCLQEIPAEAPTAT